MSHSRSRIVWKEMKKVVAHFCLSVLFNAWVGLQFTRITSLKNRLHVQLPLRSTTLDDPDRPIWAIEKHYNGTMCKNTVPLFRDFATYYKSLPIREVGGMIPNFKLCDLPYWVDEDELQEIVNDLEAEKFLRSVVHYVVAPSKAGKTASILPAFLESTKSDNGYQHYIYIACHNNGELYFKMLKNSVAVDEDAAEDQGALFMFESLKLLFNANFATHKLDLDGLTVPTFNETEESLTQYIQESIPGEGKILIHVDEHHMMCDLDTPQAGAFRRGAMSVLSAVPRVTVIGTFTSVPYEIPPSESSQVCRYPIGLASLDVEKLMMAVTELNFTARYDPNKFAFQEKGLWVTLKLRLALKMYHAQNKGIGLMGLQSHLLGYSNTQIIPFLNDFYDAFMKAPSAEKALINCCNLVALPTLTQSDNVHAFELLLGVEDKDDIVRKGENLIRLKSGLSSKLTADLLTLLSSKDPNHSIYSDGRNRLAKVLSDTVNVENNFLFSTPLEASYAWVLSCISAKYGALEFGVESKRFKIECSSLEAGRIFPADNATDYSDFSVLEDNTIYYVVEGKGYVSHPLCDIFLCTANKEVVMIDVTGSLNGETVKRKASKLRKWIKAEQSKPKNDGYELNGIVLAPFINGSSSSGDGVTIVRGDEAQGLLGGLWQIAKYFKRK